MIGQTLGHYEITGSLGKGGMGEVWRARDTKLGREVAIKTLPTSLAADADRLARFEREAKLLATLNHAHIASIYGLDEHQGTRFLAMELIEGQTLEERLREGALPAGEALRLGLQIAQALEAAHEKGVVHRDLKPANVMITRDVVKVLDFGLAKAFSGKPEEASPAHSPALSLAMTQQGLILGTAAYMSPEQASGQATDQRADVWAFGVVLYEMLTGMQLFSGESVPHVLADVLRTEPDWSRLPKNLHPRVKLLLERCLVKKPRNRYHSMADVRIDLEQVLADPRGIDRRDEMHSTAARPLAARLASGVAFIVAGAVFAALAAWMLRPEPESPRVVRLSHTIDALTGVSFPSVSRDGTRVAYVAGTPPTIHVLDTREFGTRPIADTAGIVQGFQCLSPDGSWMAFAVSANEMRKVSVTGGRSVPLGISEQTLVVGCDWADDGYVYIPSAAGIIRMIESGGGPESVTTVDLASGEQAHLAPQLLPGGRQLLYSSVAGLASGEFKVQTMVFDLDTLQSNVVSGIDGMAQYLRSKPDPALGHLVYGQAGTLFAAPFDVQSRRAGPAVPIVEGVLNLSGLTVAAVSNEGTLAYMTGTNLGTISTVPSIVGSDGTLEQLPAAGRPYIHVSVSSAAHRAAFSSFVFGEIVSADVWIHDFDTGEFSRLPLPGFSLNPLWTKDGERIIYISAVGIVAATTYVNSVRVDGSDTPLTLAILQNKLFTITSVAPDDSLVIGILYDSANNGDIFALPLVDDSGESPATEADLMPLLVSPANVEYATFSPDGHWIAYNSDETGQDEIYVVSYPELGRPVQVTTAGGQQPRWHPAGSTLFYRDGMAIMAVTVDMSGTDRFEHGAPMQIAEATIVEPVQGRLSSSRYDVMPDGERFLTLGDVNSAAAPVELRVIVNLAEELRVQAPLSGLR